ncbi:MAG: hypothetical protein QOF76_1410 [Solirubrobacteraceae bacterium]|jgi:hypothetical protein|nr:hypothetical protein [Solirubrobacteraceae bacterium]
MSSIEISTPASHEVSIGALDDTNRAHLHALALGVWREAESQVQARWIAFLAADRPSRRRASFAAYLTALDAEGAAAEALAHMHLDRAVAV